MAQLPQFQSEDMSFQMMQNKWASQLDPVLANLLVNGQLIRNQSLTVGNNVINHKLGRNLIGWFITDIDSVSSIYRVPNDLSKLQITLNSSAVANVDLWVF